MWLVDLDAPANLPGTVQQLPVEHVESIRVLPCCPFEFPSFESGLLVIKKNRNSCEHKTAGIIGCLAVTDLDKRETVGENLNL